MSVQYVCDICGQPIKAKDGGMDTEHGQVLKPGWKFGPYVVTGGSSLNRVTVTGDNGDWAPIRMNLSIEFDSYVQQNGQGELHVHHDCLIHTAAAQIADRYAERAKA